MLASVAAFAQTTVSSAPYSCFGVGDIMTSGTAYTRSMGGVGVALRDNLYLNTVNPASITERDSLSFMADFSVSAANRYFRQSDARSASNTFNIGDLAFSIPLWRHTAAMAGLEPYSGSAYAYSYSILDPEIIGNTGNISYTASGTGGLYKLYAAAAADLFKGLSLGLQFNYYFGQTTKSFYETFTNSSYNGAKNGYDISLNGIGGKIGLQYEFSAGPRSRIVAGATVSTPVKLKGQIEGYKYSTGTAAVDTLYHKADTLWSAGSGPSLPWEYSFGLAYRYADKWMVELDYSRSDWRGTAMDSTPGLMGNLSSGQNRSSFSATAMQSLRAGFEYTPNRYDARYFFKRCTYRGGAFYRDEYYKLDGHSVRAFGLSLGMTLPVFGGYNGRCPNGLTLGMEFGQKGSMANGLIRERFINFTVGINIFDIWFQKPRYE